MINDESTKWNTIESWLELFVMIKNKNTFKFGQLTMNIEVFEVFEQKKPFCFIDISNVKFGLLAKIETKRDFDKFLETFEANVVDFIPLSDYEKIENATFTGEAKELILKATGRGITWINSEWSDKVNLQELSI